MKVDSFSMVRLWFDEFDRICVLVDTENKLCCEIGKCSKAMFL